MSELAQRAWHERHVLFAVALVDPFSARLAPEKMRVRVDGLRRDPVVNLSGHIVFLEEQGAVPGRVRVVSDGAPYGPAEADPPDIANGARLVVISLLPLPAYSFPSWATVPRAGLRDGAAAMPDVAVDAAFAGPEPHPVTTGGITDAAGQFALPLRFNPATLVPGEPAEAALALVFRTPDGQVRRRPGLVVPRAGSAFLDRGRDPPTVIDLNWNDLDEA